MKYQDRLLYGKEENKVLVYEAMGVPDVKWELDDIAKTKPHIAIVEGEWWSWDVSLQQWALLVPFTTFKQSVPLNGDTSSVQPAGGYYITDILIKVFAPEAAVKIGITAGGDEIMIEQALEADKWYPIGIQVIVDEADVEIFVSGLVGIGMMIIYKSKI